MSKAVAIDSTDVLNGNNTTPVKPDKKAGEELDEELNEELDEESQKALIEAQELEQKLEALKTKVKDLEETLSKLQPGIGVIYTKYEIKDANTKLKDIEEVDINELTNYINTYKEYIKTLDEIAFTENEKGNNSGFFDSYVVQPISNSISKMFDKAKNGIAKLATGTGKFWTDTFARSIEQMEPSLKRIQEAKARIYGTATQGAIPQVLPEGLPQGIPNVTESVANTTQNAMQGLTSGIESVSNTLPVANSALLLQSGGRYYNIKEVQKGGTEAAKRAENSIKQFLSSSVTSSHILNMVKRKTRAKRKRNGKRYSRKRAKK
jgi:hypothetical protein